MVLMTKLINNIFSNSLKSTITPILVVVIVLLPFFSFAQWAPSTKSVKKAELTLSKVLIHYDSMEVLDLNENYFEVLNVDGVTEGYLCYEQAPSKHDHFDFMAVFDKEMKLVKLQVLQYRENYGGEISNKRWLNQLVVREPNKVQAISGATISVNSIKNAVDILSERMQKWYSAQL